MGQGAGYGIEIDCAQKNKSASRPAPPSLDRASQPSMPGYWTHIIEGRTTWSCRGMAGRAGQGMIDSMAWHGMAWHHVIGEIEYRQSWAG